MRYQRFVGISASVLAAALAAAPAASAQTTGQRMEQKAEKTGDSAKSMANEAKTGVSDSWLTAKAKIALFADDRVKGRQVNVETTNGVVTLRGKVDSSEAKSAAESIAKSVDGVRSVKNELQVVAPTDRSTVDASDSDLKKAVEDTFAKDPRLSKLDVRADKGVVTLTGEADGIGTSARASEIARSVPGVRAVKNDLTFKEARADRTMGADRRVGNSGTGAYSSNRQEHVRLMQEALKKEGFDPGPIDGVQGPQTTAAIEAYQKAENLTVTGRADAETLGKLKVSSGAATPKKRQSP